MYFYQAEKKAPPAAPQSAGDWFLNMKLPQTITCTSASRLRGLPKAADHPRRPAHPALVKIAFTTKGKRRKVKESAYQKAQRAYKMEGSLRRLVDGMWHELPGADAPPCELVNRGYVEERKDGWRMLYRITKAGRRLYKKIEAVPQPDAQRWIIPDWQRELNLIMCLG